ncbi:hypothetical protein BGX34_007395 [Mortierella sp. NVP85]|nr:hypothetical protein BGX34_007395 [Mortierella sp. NVP85]
MNEIPLQYFRAQSSPNVIAIPTRHDRRTGEYIVCWADIQQHFENAKSIVHGNVAILFLTDDNFERLVPLRIAYHPGVTLEVVIADNRQGGTVASTASSSSSIHSISNTVDALRITEAGTDNQALVIHSQSPTLETRMRHVSSQRHIALGSSREDEPSSRVCTLTDGNATQQEQLHRMQQQIDRTLQEIQQTKELMHQLQQRADDIQQMMHQKDEQATQKTLQLQQRIDDFHQTTQETDQHIEQIQQQVDDILHKDQQADQAIELIRQQVDNIVQKLQQMEQTHEEDKDGDQQATPSEQKTHRDAAQDLNEALLQQRLSFDRLLSIRSRVQTLLAQSFQESPVPRLFIVLPKATGLVGQDGRLFFSRFRLYFLCECGAHTMNKNSNKIHKVHLAYHTGHDLNNHNAFFDKYGPYLLTMMYMFKYGAISSGRVVSPLLDLKADLGKDRFGFSMKDINRLADDMIMYLEDAICTNPGDNDPTFDWELDPSELAQLRSYLKAEDENVFGSLCHTKTLDRHSVWICKEHQREYHESTLVTLHQIKEAIMANGGEYIEEQNKTTIRITSDKLAKRFLEAMKIVHWIHNPNDQWLLKGLGHELGCRHSIAMSIAHILIDHNITDSLVLDFGRFSLITSISQEGTRNMELEVMKLCDLAFDDLTSISECLYKQLTIVNTPQEADEDRLVTILQHSAKLEVLRIGCKANRSLAVINLIISTREKFLQCGSPLSLQSFELMDEGLAPVDMYELSNSLYGHITSTLKFSKDAKAFDMFADVKFPNSSSEYGPVLDFVRNYGWAVETLVASSLLNNEHAEIILGAIRDRGSRITTLDIVPVAISADGYNNLDEIIKMSPNLVSLGLWCPFLGIKSAVGRAEATIGRYKNRLHNLRLSGTSIENWLPRIHDAFPTRDIFPKMCGLSITGHYGGIISGSCVRWIVAMVSAPPQSSSATPSLESLARLKRLILSVAFEPKDWKSVMRSIDTTELEWLEFKGSNFSQKELELLVHQFVGNDAPPARLRTLCIGNKLLEQEDVRALCATLREKIPLIEIK